MDPLVIVMVLTAAVLHAVWNAVVKVDDDRLMAMTVVIGTTGLLAPILLLFGPNPAPRAGPTLPPRFC